MYHSTAFLAILSCVGASVIPRTASGTVWQVTQFSASSAPAQYMNYALDVSNGIGGSGSCSATTTVTSTDCAGADGPAAFPNTTCHDGNDGTYWSWSLTDAKSPTEPPQDGFSLKVAYNEPGEVPLYGCRFFVYNTTCFTDPNNPNHASESLVAPSAFNLTATTNSECIYA